MAPTASAASAIPSSTRCGARASSSRSLPLAGSDSAPFATTTVPPGPRSGPAFRLACATARILRPAGKLAPPRPVSPDRSTSVIRSVAPSGTGPYRSMWSASGSGPPGGMSRGSPDGGSARRAGPAARMARAALTGCPRSCCCR